MLGRLKFDIDPLINEMLDQLPKDIIINGTFLDPAIGGGQFVKEVERRKRAAGKTDSEIRSTVFGIEENVLRKNYAVNKHKLVGNYEVANFLDKDFKNMKFDVILGNPPYQKAKTDSRLGSRGDTSLWDKFVTKGLELLNDGGYLEYIHPNSWRKPEDRNGFWKLLTQDNQMHKLIMSSGKKDQDWFGIGVRVDAYILEKNPKYKKTTVRDHENNTYELDLSKYNWLPNFAINEITKLLGTGTEVLYNTFYHTQKDHREYPDSTYCNPVVHTINQNGLGIKYFESLQDNDRTHYGIKKVLLNQNELQYPHNDFKGEYGMSQLTFGIAIKSKSDGEKLVEFLNSGQGKRIIAATKWNTYYTDYGMFKDFKKDFYK
jgi:hypothetical protein